uniref:Zinc finger (CCCH type) protein, putative n=1 Tax=Neospora caninum (strain Liverpool) TaxID=572307 RepID=F0JB76_NEOCL|nr:zinc finger (CCCH type) protein, putative [Neospora caninum Liverpool]CEL71343.1 TPA: zinc finger (CCCH type) protein, putative [Neospora caninum Liverpool]
MYELLFFRSLAAGSGCRDFRKEEEVRKGLGLVTDNLDAPKGSDTDDWNSRSRKPLANKCSPTTSERGISAEGRRRAYSSSTLDLVTDHHDLLSNLVPLAPSQEHRGKPGFLTPARTEPAYTQQTSCEQLDLPSREEYCTGAVQASARFTNGQTAREKEDYLFSEDADAPRHASSCPVRTSDVLVPSEGGATHANTGTGKRRKKGSNALVGCRNRKDQNMNCTEVLRWKQEQLFAAAECNRWSPATIATNQKQVGCHSAVGCGKERFLQIGRGSSEVGGEMNTGSIASQVDSHQTLWQSTSLQRGNMATRKNGGMKRRDLRKTAERFILKDDSSKLEIMPSPPPPPPTTVVLDDPLGNSAFELYLTGSCPFLSAAAWHTQPTPGQTHMQLLLSQLQQLQRARVERLSGELPRNIQQQHLEGTKGESSKRRLNTGGKLLERDERWCSRLSGPQEAAEARVGSEREESYLQQQFSPSQLVGEGIQNETFPGNRAFIPERDTCNAALRSSANKTLPGMRKPHIGTGSNLTAPYASGVRRLKAPSICRNHLMPAAGVDDVVAMWLGCKASQEKRPSSSCCNASNPEGPTLDVLGITALVAPQRAVESVDFMRECDEERLGRADSLKGGPAACGSLSAAVSLQAPLPAYEELGNFESTSTEVSWSSGGGPGNTGSSSVSPGSAVEIVGVSDGLPALASPQTWVSSRTDVAANFGADWDRRGAVGFPVVSGDESSPEAEAARVFAALGPETVKVEKRTTGLSPFPYPSIDLAQEALTMENHRRQQWYGDFGNDGGSTAEQVAGTLPMAGAAVSQALDWLTVASQADDSWIVHSHAERLPGRADCVVRNSLGHPVPRCSLGMVDASARREAGHALRGEQEWSVGDRSWPPRDITWMTAALSGHKDKSFTSSPITQEDIATLTSTEPHPGFKLAARSPSPREDAESCCLYQVRTESKDSNLTASATCRHHDVVEEKVINGDYVHGDGKVEIPTRYDLVSQASHGSIDSSTASSDSSGGSEPSWDASVGARPFFVESDTTSHTNVYIPPARRNEGAKCAIASEEAKHHTQELHQAEECFEKTYYESFCTASGQEVHRDAFIGGKLGFHHDLTSLRGEDSWPNRFGGMAGQCSGPEELSFFNVEVDEAGSALLAFTRSRAGLDSRPDNRSLGHASGNLTIM